jgi:multidrug efflux pump subunit AcrA (membrane-fusion protein)
VGQFIQGELNTTQKTALTLPINSIILRDGFSYVFVINPNTYKVTQTKVLLGQRQDTSVEVIAGLSDKASVVGAGASFLADGDTVKVVQ